MKKIHYFLLSSFFPTLLVSVFLFSSLLELADLYQRLTTYAEVEVPTYTVAYLQLLHLPFCIWQTMPLSILFASVYTIGNLYVNNEIIAIFSSGVSFRRFVFPIIVFAVFLSIFQFFFQEFVVIRASYHRDVLYDEISQSGGDFVGNNFRITVADRNYTIFYNVDYYNDSERRFSNAQIIHMKEDFSFYRMYTVGAGTWNESESIWDLEQVSIFELNDKGEVVSSYQGEYSSPDLNKDYRAFQSKRGSYSTFTLAELRETIELLKASDIVRSKEEFEYYSRFSFCFASSIAALMALSVGSRLKKNILLFSLLASLLIAVFYYVTRMIAGVYSDNELLSPVLAAGAGELVSLLIAIIMLYRARS